MNIPLVEPEYEQLPIVVEAERGWAVCQEAAVFEPVHHGNGEAMDSAVHGDCCCYGNSDVVRALCDLESFRDSCKVAGQQFRIRMPAARKCIPCNAKVFSFGIYHFSSFLLLVRALLKKNNFWDIDRALIHNSHKYFCYTTKKIFNVKDILELCHSRMII